MEEREFIVKRDGKRIYTTLRMEKGEGKRPVLILSHGFGGDGRGEEGFARYFAERGFITCAPDFAGGGRGSRSDGETWEMSPLTEVRDLWTVTDAVCALEEADDERVFLFGESQGGLVSSLAAAERPESVAGLVALFPAYVIPDDTKKRVPDPEQIPERMDVMGLTLGAVYHRDALSIDLWGLLPRYPGPVLLLHGTEDTLVPISYSERAAETFPNAHLIPVEGAGHGFGGEAWMLAARETERFLDGILSGKTE